MQQLILNDNLKIRKPIKAHSKGIEMAKKGELLICQKCGNEITVTKEGGNPHIDCCGQHMTPKKENK